MRNTQSRLLAAAVIAAFAGAACLIAQDASAQKKIVCWKDKAGKVVGCGDTVPPEYQTSATKELDSRGMTRKTTDTAEEQAKTSAQDLEAAKKKEEDKKRQAEQRRQDQALLNTFSNEKEIDLKRDRELQSVDGQLTQLRVTLKNAQDREKEIRGRIETTTKGGKPATDTQKEDIARAEAEEAKAAQNIAAKQNEQNDIRKRYAEMKKRYIELKGGGAPAPAATTAAAPAAPAAAKK